MEKTAMQFAIEWVNDNYPKFNHYEIEAKLTELRDTVEKEQTNTLQSENDRLRERVRELEEWISVDNPPEVGEFVLVYNTEGATLIGRLLNNGWAAIFLDGEKLMGELTALFWKNLPQPPSTALLTKPDSTGGGEKEVCKCERFYGIDKDNRCCKCTKQYD